MTAEAGVTRGLDAIRRAPGLAMLAVCIARTCQVASVLVEAGADWHHVMGPPFTDTGVIVDVGPHAWWRVVDPEDLADIVDRWHARGLFHVEPAILPPVPVEMIGRRH